MADFNDFVQTELPKRPFVNQDGTAGQIPVRSNNPNAPLELVWVNPSDVAAGAGSPANVILTNITGAISVMVYPAAPISP